MFRYSARYSKQNIRKRQTGNEKDTLRSLPSGVHLGGMGCSSWYPSISPRAPPHRLCSTKLHPTYTPDRAQKIDRVYTPLYSGTTVVKPRLGCPCHYPLRLLLAPLLGPPGCPYGSLLEKVEGMEHHPHRERHQDDERPSG